MKNTILKKSVRFLQRLILKHPKKDRILVVSTTALGDTLWATPALQNLRSQFPQAYLAVLTSPIGREILKHNPSIDQLHLLKEPLLPSFFSLWKVLYKERFDTVLLFHASQRLALPLCSLLGASRIIGTAGINKGLDSLLTRPLSPKPEHEIVRRLRIAEAIGAARKVQTLSFHLQPEERFHGDLGKKPWIAIHPGSKDGFKRWPAENFAAIGNLLKEAFPCEILITGNDSEKALMQEVASQIPGAQLYETKTPFRSFAALLEQMDLLISNDTGPVHLACSLNRPVLALYSSTDPRLCGPHLAKNAIALFKGPTCEPCLKRKCNSPFCLLQFSPEEVFDSALKLLNKKDASCPRPLSMIAR